jgi:hypothetical protein
MLIKLGQYSFEGPYDGAKFLQEQPGVFVVLCKELRNESKFYILDVDESETVRTSAMNHPRQVEWVKKSRDIGKLAVAVNYTHLMKKEDRQKMVSYIRELFNAS